MGKSLDILGLLGLRKRDRAKHADVLDWVNDVRHSMKMPRIEALPLGKRTDPEQCVISRALSAGCKHHVLASPMGVTFYLDATGRSLVRFSPPKAVKHFINQFDRGELPELEQL